MTARKVALRYDAPEHESLAETQKRPPVAFHWGF